MSITDKTRKALWAKSGNRCSICRLELVQELDGVTDNLVIGEECHIVSPKRRGPRGDIDFSNDFDCYDNLILLCANDHKRIDELADIYTAETLRSAKNLHETWVRTTLERDAIAFANDKHNIKSLPRILSGKQLVDIVNGSHLCDFRHVEFKTEDEATEVGGLLEELKEYGDILSEMGYVEVGKLGLHLNGEIEKLKQMGFLLFGMKRRLRLRNSENEHAGVYETATLIITRQDNPSIVGDFLIAKFPSQSYLTL